MVGASPLPRVRRAFRGGLTVGAVVALRVPPSSRSDRDARPTELACDRPGLDSAPAADGEKRLAIGVVTRSLLDVCVCKPPNTRPTWDPRSFKVTHDRRAVDAVLLGEY